MYWKHVILLDADPPFMQGSSQPDGVVIPGPTDQESLALSIMVTARL